MNDVRVYKLNPSIDTRLPDYTQNTLAKSQVHQGYR